ncbi:YggS family pyridoxal phosphate-dependent enzyme [Thalassomonas sp. M1454]|uniref:YggS family pyridoxal phosphate-dependent enzyme n=1 Tax=Thalassomonas sp. M1454 TaxID=2594477 RepID=UPI00117C76DA|nr:YggS family pyridoxal phosphate-dependent enzyme [Thalassomonas sp. M1454]TRX55837.1 YggS family pyridoxal phosphate-dependent enzyme [Thalassomonas sp. M1454]
MINIAANLTKINEEIEIASNKANRSSATVSLLAVSKTKPSQLVQQGYDAGQRQFGENYVQEAVDKIHELAHLTDICWHFIGPIQSNKTRLIAENVSWVHSVDRIKIAKRLNEQRDNNITPLNVCLQVNISGEQSKSGALINEVAELADYINNCENLTLRGLMAIPENSKDEAVTRKRFKQMQTLFNQLQHQYPSVDTLSMGMSGDLAIAIECGSTMIRVGTAIFGSRS